MSDNPCVSNSMKIGRSAYFYCVHWEFEHGMNVVDRVLVELLCKVAVTVCEMLFGFMPVKGTSDDVLIMTRLKDSL